MDQLHGNQLEALALESLDNFTDESSLNSIGFDHDEGSLFVVSHTLDAKYYDHRNKKQREN